MKHIKLAVPLLLLAILLSACSGGSDAPAGAESSAPSPSGETSPPEAPQAPDPSRQILAPGSVFTLPDGWVREQPASQMRLAQARIPGSGGPGVLTVFHLGAGSGGDTDANLQRWIGQMEVEGEPSRESFTLGSWKVTWVEVAGTLKPDSMGFGSTEPQPGSRLFGAVIEGDGGPWFFKATGPADTLDAQRAAFLDLLKSGRPHS